MENWQRTAENLMIEEEVLECLQEAEPTGERVKVTPQERSLLAQELKRQRRSGELRCLVCGWEPYHLFPMMIHAHHVVPVAAGGANTRANVVLLCPNHHSLAHAMFAVSKGRYHGPRSKVELLGALQDPDLYYECQRNKIRSLLR